MKPIPTVLFSVSLGFNAALAYYALAGAHPESADAANRRTRATAAVAAGAKGKAATPGIDPETWTSIESRDLATLVARLRDTGFPIEMIRAILAAQINESFAARRKALDPEADRRPFWKNRPPDPRIDVALRQTYREQQKMMRDLLGKDAEADDPLSTAFQGRRVDGLPPDKVEVVKQLVRDFDDQRQDLYAGGTYNLEREKMAALEKAQHDAIARLLTPQELEEYDLRNSNTASSMRYDLAVFNATEEEFRALFRLRQPFDEKFNLNYVGGPLPQDQMRQRSEAQKLLNEQIKTALGPERAAEYERTTDYSYRQTSQLVARLEMPPETTGQVYAVQKEFQQRLTPIFSNRELTPEARNQQLSALGEEAKTRISSVLGPRGFEAYRQYGGSWLQQLAPRPTPPAVPPRN